MIMKHDQSLTYGSKLSQRIKLTTERQIDRQKQYVPIIGFETYLKIGLTDYSTRYMTVFENNVVVNTCKNKA